MKTNRSILALLVASALTLGIAVPFSGCSSTATRSSTGEYIDDTVTTTKVKAALAADKEVSAMAVSVETFKGTVQLSGFVDTASEKAQAERVARGINGVMNVENNITVKPQP